MKSASILPYNFRNFGKPAVRIQLIKCSFSTPSIGLITLPIDKTIVYKKNLMHYSWWFYVMYLYTFILTEWLIKVLYFVVVRIPIVIVGPIFVSVCLALIVFRAAQDISATEGSILNNTYIYNGSAVRTVSANLEIMMVLMAQRNRAESIKQYIVSMIRKLTAYESFHLFELLSVVIPGNTASIQFVVTGWRVAEFNYIWKKVVVGGRGYNTMRWLC